MEHPNHACEEKVVLGGQVVAVIQRCKRDNGKTLSLGTRRMKLLRRAETHKGRVGSGVVAGGEYNGRITTRYAAEKPARCGCGRVQRHCTPGKQLGTRCSCGQFKPCGEVYGKGKGA